MALVWSIASLQRRVWFAYLSGGMLWLACLSGCGSSETAERLPVHPVAGTIKFGGERLEGAFVVLHPVEGSDPRALPARGYVDAQGNFRVTTYEANDGAAVGQYVVTVVHTPLIERDGDKVAGPNVLPAKYATSATSELKVPVVEGPNTLPEISLVR